MSEGTVKPEAAIPAKQDSSPVAKESVAPAPIVEAGAKPETVASDNKAVTGLKTELFKTRAKARDAEAGLNAITERLSALEKAITEAPKAKSDEWENHSDGDDDGKMDAKKLAQLEKRILDGVEHRLTRRETEAHVYHAKVEANNWLLSREHLKADPKAVAEMAEILEIPAFQDLADRNPRAAAKAAYMEWCEQKGITPDVGIIKAGIPSDGAKPTGGVKKSGDEPIGVEALKGLQYGTKEYEDTVKRLEDAARKGNYKGKVIKL